MPNNRVAIYPGSFDPVHIGHGDTVRTASKLFDKVIWAILLNPSKRQSMFTIEQRMEMMRLANTFPNVEIASFDGLLVKFALKINAGVIIRSMRMVSMDFETEFQMTLVNKKLAPELTTVYLPAEQNHMHMSSTAIRELITNNEPVDEYLAPQVIDFIASTHGK